MNAASGAPFTVATIDFKSSGLAYVLIAIEHLLGENHSEPNLNPADVAQLKQIQREFRAAALFLGRPASRKAANG